MAKFEINVDVHGAASITSLDNQLKSLDKTAQTTGKGIDTASKSTDAMANSLKSLGAIIATVGLVELGRKAVQTADVMNLLEGRVSLVTKSLNEQIAVQKELFKVAQNTRQGLEATTTLYTNLATSMTAMGKSQADIIKMTETVNKAMVVSGSSTQQAQAAIMQLGQAFASGTLRGDELNSIMENSKGLAQAIASGMGVPIGKLRELGSEGKITSEILAAALEKSASDIDAKFGKLPQTVGQSLTQVQNSIMSLVGVADDAVNGTGGLSEIFSHFSKYLDQNQADVIEFGADFLRVMQLIGAGALTTISGVQVLIHGITGGIIGAIELSINAVLMFINSAIAMAETGYNKIRSLGGFDAKALGRIKNVDLGSKSQFAGMKKDTDDFNIGLKAMGSLFDDIANKTTVIKSNVADLNKKPLPDGKGGTTKEKKGAKEKTAEQIIKEEHDKNQAILDGIQKKTDNQQKYDEMVYSNIKKTEDATKSMYASMLQASGDWYTSESVKIGEQYNEWEKLGVDKLALQEWLNVSILSIDEKRIKEQQEIDKKALDEKNKLWDDFFKDLDKAMDNQLFDAMSGKWESFGSWLKDFWSSLTTSIARAASSQLSQSLIGGIKDMMGLGTSGEASWIQNAFKATAGASLGVGSTLSASQLSSLGGISDAMGFTTTSGGTVVDASGQITKAGTDIAGMVDSISSLSKVYQLATNGLTSMMYAPSMYMGQLAGTAYGAGMTGTGSFLAGSSNVLAGGGVTGLNGAGMAGGLATAGIAGGIGGYAMGSIGDKLFGAETKAANYGAMGGAIGAMAGSVIPGLGTIIGGVAGAAIGSLIGGAFGTKKVKDQGLSFAQESAASNVDQFVMSFVDMQKKSWFSNKKWTEYKELSQTEKDKVSSIFDTYDYLLGALGDNDKIFIQAGKYSGQSFIDQLAKNFISVVKTGGDTTEIYNTWKDYAKQIGVTIQEAFGASIQEMITSQRTFQEWAFGSGTIEQIAFTANYLQKDFEALANSMGVTNVNVGNFSTMYDSAIKANFTPENIAKWNSLGESLMATTDATTAYNNALLEQNSIIDDMLNKSMEGLRVALDGVNMIAKKTISLFNSLKGSTSALRGSLLSSTSGDTTKYYLTQFQDLKKEFMSNFDSSGLVYANSIEKMESDYAKLTESISNIEGVGTVGQKSALVGQLDIFGQMFDKNSQALSVLIVGDETGSASESTLTNVEQWIKSLYAVQEQAKIAETAALSQSSFVAGKVLGTQEKIDFAKATGLTIGSSAFNQAIVDIQGFDTKNESQDISHLASLSSTSLSAISSLGSSGVLPTDISTAISSKSSLDSIYNSKIEPIDAYIQRGTALQEALVMYANGWYGYSGGSHNATLDSYIQEFGGAYPFAYSRDGVVKMYTNITDQTIQSYIDAANISKNNIPRGYLQGGYTGDIATNQIAGVTHGQEYVVNAKTTRDLGLNNSGGLFREMANEIKSLKNEVLKLNQVAMSQLREAIGGNIIMRQVTNGGNAMMIEVI